MSMPSQPVVTPPPKKSGTSKFLLGCGGIFLVLCLICCGGVGYVAYSIKGAFTSDPAKTQAVAATIADFDSSPLASSEPTGAYDGWFPGVGKIRGAMYTPKGTQEAGKKHFFVIAEFPAGIDQQAAEKQINDSVNKQAGADGNEKFDTKKLEAIEHAVNGKPGHFQINQLIDSTGKVAGDQVIGTFVGKGGGLGIVIITMADDEEDLKAAKDFIQSLK